MIEVRPHIGQTPVPGRGFKKVDVGQDRVFVDGQCVGYIGRQPNAPLVLLGELPEAMVGDIKRHINELRNETWDRRVAVPPKLGTTGAETDDDEQWGIDQGEAADAGRTALRRFFDSWLGRR